MTALESCHRQGFQALLGVAGVPATYYPAGGLESDELTVRGYFLERYERFDPLTLQVIGTAPAFELVYDDLPNALDGDRLYIPSKGLSYNVIEAKRNHDGVGKTLLILSRGGALPIAPSRLNAQLNMGNIELGWTRNATNNTAVEVWSDADGDGNYVRIATLAAGAVTHSDSALAVGYKIRNTNKSGPSRFTHIWNTQVWGLVDESGVQIADEDSGGIEGTLK